MEHLFYLPGDFLLGQIVINFRSFSRFFELNETWCHEFLSGLVGFAFWGFCSLMILGVLLSIYEIFENLLGGTRQPK